MPVRTPAIRTMSSSLVTTGLLATLTMGALPVGTTLPDPSAVARESEPVVLTGSDVPDWSMAAATGQPATFPAGTGDEVPGTDGVRSAHHGTVVVPPDPRADSNAPVEAVAAYRHEPGGRSAWAEVPVQVDERFPHFLANARSDFAFYSGVDTELTYAWGGDGRHTVGEEAWKKVAGQCEARYPASLEEAQALAADGVITPGQGEQLADYLGPKPDPVAGVDDDDEIALMASDAGPRADADLPAPAGTDPASRHEVTLLDPVTGERTYLYLFLAEGGSSFTSTDGHVDHRRDDTADLWASRATWTEDDPEKLGTSNTGYGANLPGTACAVADGTDHDTRSPETFTAGDPVASDDRFPLDGATIETGTYRFRASGRWMVRAVQVAAPDTAVIAPGQRPATYGPDLVDRWKGRAFQQSPDSEISVVGFEDEQVNWEANSTLLGWRSGPVRTIREVWGADSGTNVTQTTTFTRDAVQQRYRVRVHPIPPDGLYTSWDHNRDTAACYYTAVTVLERRSGGGTCEGGVPIDGADDDVGNLDGLPAPADCDLDALEEGHPPAMDGCQAFFDLADPTLDLPLAFDRWEQVSGTGDAGSLVYLFTLEGASSLTNPVVIPYYRDDACLDDGTGDDPVARPFPGEDSSDPRVRAGYEQAHGGTAYDELDCTQRQGAFGSHGLHFLVTGDTDNGFVGSPVPVNEIDGSQWQFTVPTAAPGALGEQYAQVVRAPLQPVLQSQPGSEVEESTDEDRRCPPADRGKGRGPERCRT